MLELLLDPIVLNAAENLVDTIRAWAGPVLLLMVGIAAITFITRRQVMQLAIFLLIVIIVAIIFYAPGVLLSIAKAFVGDTELSTGNTW